MAYTVLKPEEFKGSIQEFRDKANGFMAGEVAKNEFKGFSGYYGSYAQKDAKSLMLRLRMPAGRITQPKMKFLADAMKRYDVKVMHFTTCQAIQLHDLNVDQTCGIMEEALDVGIITMGGGGDFPRNTMCSPLSGVEAGEYFDVLPYAEITGEYALNILKLQKMPRKLKICFSNSPANLPHATFRDLGFVAREDGLFDVYSAGGLGNQPKFGVKVAEAVDPSDILYYVKAMYNTFCAYGNYENRGKARTRYMQDICGGPEAYREAYLAKLAEVMASGEDLKIAPEIPVITKTGDGSSISGKHVIAQKQDGLYAVVWHPIGGKPSPEEFMALAEVVAEIPEAEIRIAPDETAYIINLTGTEAEKVLAATAHGAETLFETSVSCIGASICQVGVRASQELLNACVAAVKEAGIPDGALPQIHISGCPSSCGTHQTGAIGFRGGVKKVDGKMQPAFVVYFNGCEKQGQERMGRELGVIVTEEIPAYLVELGQAAAADGKDFEAWVADETALEAITAKYIK